MCRAGLEVYRVFSQLMLLSLLVISLTPALSEAQSDGWIRGEVRARLLTAGLRPLRMSIRVKNGVVALSGRAASDEAIQAAEQIVSGIPGVSGIENNLRAQPGLIDVLRGDPYSSGETASPQQSSMPRSVDRGGNSILFNLVFIAFGIGFVLTLIFLGLLIHRKFEEKVFREEFLGEESAEEHADIYEYKSFLNFRRKTKKKRKAAD